MSRSQQGQVFKTAQEENATNETNAQASESKTQADIGSQQSQLAKFAANNPYVQGGEFSTATNKEIAGTADATAAAARAQAQDQARRTGQNPAAANAAGEAEAEAAQREMSTQEAGATRERIGSEATYNKNALEAGNTITDEQSRLAALESGAAQGALSSQEEAAKTPSFLDQLGSGLISGGIAAGTSYLPHN